MHQGQGEQVDSGNLNPLSLFLVLRLFSRQVFAQAIYPCWRTLRSRLIGQYNGFWIALPRSGPIRALKSAAIGKKGRC